MIELTQLRARIQELERFKNLERAPASVRARGDFDLEALRELLALREEKGGERKCQ